MCSANVDMAIKSLNLAGEISTSGTYKDGTYFKLTEDERELEDEKAEEICLATRSYLFLRISYTVRASKNYRTILLRGTTNTRVLLQPL